MYMNNWSEIVFHTMGDWWLISSWINIIKKTVPSFEFKRVPKCIGIVLCIVLGYLISGIFNI